MTIEINFGSVYKEAFSLEDIAEKTERTIQSAVQHGLSPTYSQVSGLDQLANSHSNSLVGGSNSAAVALTEYAIQIRWAADTLHKSVHAIESQELFNSQGLSIANPDGTPMDRHVLFQAQPMPTIAPFHFLPPTVLPTPKLELLAAQFHTTNPAQVLSASQAWSKLSAKIEEVVANLHQVASSLNSHNQGEVIDKASAKILGLAQSGQNFVVNAGAMAASVSQLNTIHATGLKIVQGMQAIVAANSTDPARAQIIEQGLLQAFPGIFTPEVLTGVPVVKHLMELPPSTGGGSAEARLDQTVAEHLPTGVGLAPSGQIVDHMIRAVEDQTGLRVNYPDHVPHPAADSLNAVGTHSAQAVPQNLQSMVPPTITGNTGGVSTSSHTNGATHLPGFSSSMIPSNSSSSTNAGGLNRFGGPGNNLRTPSSFTGGSGTTGFGVPGSGNQSAGSGALNSGSTSATYLNNQASTAMTTRGPGGLAHATHAGTSGSTATHRRRKPVKTVTSAVEREGNLLELLGPRPKIVPRVIGDWVRG
ncbi:hypothetical protein GP475_12150 [Corynebacterium poyangense]|uniref:Uncharacterized protein n=1 Tax=Corynebacterium poyangense TaxID=2684405 RepID=A0A7H0SRX7_9CORY|nr:hypothetical protein [Corynebacterium poyangense]MBZ8177244.1 hypothetical protein [Corynebacterium poyangense]QNQ91302.1 hypothetical protein GP475_12150 [Corynebacterium poyangense]